MQLTPQRCKILSRVCLALFIVFIFGFLGFAIDYFQNGRFMDAIFAGAFGGFTIGFFTSYRRFEKLLDEYDRKAEQLQQRSEALKNEEEERQRQYEARQAERERFISEKKAAFEAELEAIPHVDIAIGEPVNCSQEPVPEFRIRNIICTSKPKTVFPLVFVDVETTGLSALNDRIIEVSAIKFESGYVPVSCFSALVNPEVSISSEITQINGITNDMVADKPKFSEIANAFSDYIKDCNVAGHNTSFDLEFLFRAGIVFSPKTKFYDTMFFARNTLISEKSPQVRYDPDIIPDVVNYKLDTLCEYYNVFRETSHRALSDCYATSRIFAALVKAKAGVDLFEKEIVQ